MSVSYRCKICGREHLSPVVFTSKEAFESGALKAKTFQCAVTGRTASYVKNDLRWKD